LLVFLKNIVGISWFGPVAEPLRGKGIKKLNVGYSGEKIDIIN